MFLLQFPECYKDLEKWIKACLFKVALISFLPDSNSFYSSEKRNCSTTELKEATQPHLFLGQLKCRFPLFLSNTTNRELIWPHRFFVNKLFLAEIISDHSCFGRTPFVLNLSTRIYDSWAIHLPFCITCVQTISNETILLYATQY